MPVHSSDVRPKSRHSCDLEISPTQHPFRLPEVHRRIWVSHEAHLLWEPRIALIAKAWKEIEWQSVGLKERRCALQFLPLDQLAPFARKLARRGLAVAPVVLQRSAEQTGSADSIIARIVIGRRCDVRRFAQAWRRSDYDAIGTLLGYPPCCRSAFVQTYVQQRISDLTWAAAARSASTVLESGVVQLQGPPLLNLLWKGTGVRAVPHLPCTFTCESSLDFACSLERVARENGFQSEMDWTREILSWPAEWSALHGIAEIKTPILKFSINTAATSTRRVIRFCGTSYPKDGALGVSFPYRRRVELQFPATVIPARNPSCFTVGKETECPPRSQR